MTIINRSCSNAKTILYQPQFAPFTGGRCCFNNDGVPSTALRWLLRAYRWRHLWACHCQSDPIRSCSACHSWAARLTCWEIWSLEFGVELKVGFCEGAMNELLCGYQGCGFVSPDQAGESHNMKAGKRAWGSLVNYCVHCRCGGKTEATFRIHPSKAAQTQYPGGNNTFVYLCTCVYMHIYINISYMYIYIYI